MKKTQQLFYLPAAVMDVLRKTSEETDIPMSRLVRSALVDFLRRHYGEYVVQALTEENANDINRLFNR